MRARYYICHQIDLNATNAAPSHAGIGKTPEEARGNASYWANQYARTVAISRAPRWAVEEAVEALTRGCLACDGPRHEGVCLDPHDPLGVVLEPFARAAADWQARGRPALLANGEEVLP